jgi:hypothetical protein
MDIDWAKIRSTLERIERQLARANEVIDRTDVANEWPEVSRDELQAAFPNWREEYGNDWIRDFMEKKIGRANYRAKRGSKQYRISPQVLKELPVAPRAEES